MYSSIEGVLPKTVDKTTTGVEVKAETVVTGVEVKAETLVTGVEVKDETVVETGVLAIGSVDPPLRAG